jgi:2Fe-2S ferredoxin
MSHIVVTDEDGNEHQLDAPEGWRVMEIIRDHGLAMKGLCDGAMACATCCVELDPHWADKVPGRTDEEEAMLDTIADVGPNSRLSCQLLFSDALAGMRVTLRNDEAEDENVSRAASRAA